MVRRFDPERGVPLEVVRDLVVLATRAPSAGFSQGWDFVALVADEARRTFWEAAADSQPGPGDTTWLRGVSAAPVLLVCLADPTAYVERYAAPDKGWTDRSLDHWPVAYWDTDVAMAALLVLLGAVDIGLGALFFGVPAGCHDAVKDALGIPPDRRIVGVIALGHEAERVSGSAAVRRRRALDEVLHLDRFGVPAP